MFTLRLYVDLVWCRCRLRLAAWMEGEGVNVLELRVGPNQLDCAGAGFLLHVL